MIYLDKNNLKIKQYDKIICLENELIEIKMPHDTIKIAGKDLVIKYYSKQEVVVYGKIFNIKFI
ncbi:YabP/YqfC family sporulation protein [Thomasclavelia sp.]|uniref:YabP/YqfC family sporulation protein n=1 Tax=Thomasclavelia sp. TaxID=3025757 RepID=UPI0025DE8468|nr:YabP/YqfC family sporulation protein [Thomasclavelia sp.]